MYDLLRGLRVVEASAFVAAPSCALHLAQFGAKVVRIDQIGGGPDFRRWPLDPRSGASFYWEGLNKGKQSVALDLTRPEGRELAVRIVTAPGENAGLFVTNYPVDGYLSYEALRQWRHDLICVRIMGWPDGRPAVDYTINAAVGVPAMTGPATDTRPVNHTLPAWDLLAGAYAAWSGLVAALGLQARIVELESELGVRFDRDEGVRFAHRRRLVPLIESAIARRSAADLTAAFESRAVWAQLIDLIGGDVVAADDSRLSVVWRRPRGVVLAITPWNVPVTNVLSRAAPALAAGNAVVVKPAENCPRSAVLLARLAAEAGLPDGVFNVVIGDGPNTGRLLASHDGIDMLAFTGSSATGREITRVAATRALKPALLECGGKSPTILLDDVFGPDQLWRAVFAATFWNTGQLCVARTRIILPRQRLEEATAGLLAAAAEWPCGDPFNPATRLGPLASPRQLATVRRFMEEADSAGRLIELRCPDSGVDPNGCYMQPHLVTGIDRSSRVWREEVFGPLAVLQPFDTVPEAVDLANDSHYGLAATVWTNRSREAYAVARSLEVGIVDILSSSDSVPGWSTLQYFEPRKQSGLGIDGGLQGLRAYTAAQSVSFSH
jgi:acyl-CoA reductase-like NAD-dependent aldehyde dehydrogenase